VAPLCSPGWAGNLEGVQAACGSKRAWAPPGLAPVSQKGQHHFCMHAYRLGPLSSCVLAQQVSSTHVAGRVSLSTCGLQAFAATCQGPSTHISESIQPALSRMLHGLLKSHDLATTPGKRKSNLHRRWSSLQNFTCCYHYRHFMAYNWVAYSFGLQDDCITASAAACGAESPVRFVRTPFYLPGRHKGYAALRALAANTGFRTFLLHSMIPHDGKLHHEP